MARNVGSLTARLCMIETSNLLAAKTYVGIDNGTSGAIAALDPSDRFVLLEPVRTENLGKRLILDIKGNREILADVARQAGGSQHVVVAYEKPPMNPKWSFASGLAIGRDAEFWRVLLTIECIPFIQVHALTWQTGLLKAFRMSLPGKADPKAAARLYLAQRFPKVSLDGKYNATQCKGLRDAMCLACWARSAKQ